MEIKQVSKVHNLQRLAIDHVRYGRVDVNIWPRASSIQTVASGCLLEISATHIHGLQQSSQHTNTPHSAY